MTRYTVETTTTPRRCMRTFTGGHPGLRAAEAFAREVAASGETVQVVDAVTLRSILTVQGVAQ